MKKTILHFLIIAGVIAITRNLHSQNNPNDSMKIDYKKIYSYCLDGDVKTALAALEFTDLTKLSEKDSEFKTKFESRFKNEFDESDFLESRKSAITDLLEIYRNYWRVSLLDNSKNYDTLLFQNVANFLTDNSLTAGTLIANEDSLDIYLKKYIESFGLHTAGFGKTGKVFRPACMGI